MYEIYGSMDHPERKELRNELESHPIAFVSSLGDVVRDGSYCVSVGHDVFVEVLIELESVFAHVIAVDASSDKEQEHHESILLHFSQNRSGVFQAKLLSVEFFHCVAVHELITFVVELERLQFELLDGRRVNRLLDVGASLRESGRRSRDMSVSSDVILHHDSVFSLNNN